MQNYIKLTLEVEEMYFKGLMFSRLLRETYPNTRDIKSSDLFGVEDIEGQKVWYINTILASDMSSVFNLAALYGRYKEEQMQEEQRQAEEDERNFALWLDENYKCVYKATEKCRNDIYVRSKSLDKLCYTRQEIREIFNQS
jgi:hypothetical protein